MTNVARLSSIGTCFAFEFDDNKNSSFSVSIGSTVFSNEFDENTSTTLSGNQRMSATSTGGLIVLDSINEIDPYGEISTNDLELHLDSVDSGISTGSSAVATPLSTLSVSLSGSATNTTASISATLDASSYTSDDLVVILYQGEGDDAESNPSTFSCSVAGTAASEAISNSGSNDGEGVSGIFYVEGSVVAGNSSATISVTNSSSSFRSSIIVYRLINGSGATVASTDSSSTTSSTADLTNTVDFSSGILFSSGYFANGTNHSFTGGISTQNDGIQNASGSGDGALNDTPTTSSHTVTYGRGDTGNTQQDVLVTAVFTPAPELSITNLANISNASSSNVSSTTIDASSVNSDDLFVVTYQGEGSETPGDTFTCTINGTTATVATSNSNTSGRGRAGIFYVDGSVVAGDSTTSVSITESASGIRSSIQAFRLQNRSSAASIIVSDTDISETSNQSSQTNTVDFSNGVLFSTGHFPNGQGHSFTAGIETQYNGVQASGGSGDAGINETPTTSSHNVTYTKSGATNNEGEALATAVFSFGTDVHFWEDISGNNRDASFNGTTDPNDPAEGDFIDFDSSNNEYAVIDGDAVGSSSYNGVTGTSARTIIFGIKPDALATDSRPFSYGANSSGQRFTSRILTTNKLRVEFGNGYTETTDAIVTTDWHVFAIVVPAGGSPTINDVRIWNNGIEQDLTTSSGGSTFNTASTNNVSIGAAQHESSPSYFNGQFAKVMIYSRELDDSEIKLIYQSFLRRLI